MSHDQKVITLLPSIEKCLVEFYQGAVLLAKFDNSSPSVTSDRSWGNDGITFTFWKGGANETLWMRFAYFPNLFFLASPWLEI